MKNRFDLEQEILNCWNMVSDIELIPETESPRDAAKALVVVYNNRFQNLWKTFEELIASKQIVSKL